MFRKYFSLLTCSFLLISLFSSICICKRTLGETRLHYSVLLENGEILEYSEIYSSSNDITQIAVLFDLKEKGKWLIEQKNVPDEQGSNYATFKLLSTGEFLQIAIKGTVSENPSAIISLNANNKKSLNLTFGDVPKKSTNFIAFISDNFSKEFIEGLDKLRKINSEIYSPPIPDTYFMTIWSWEMIEQSVILKQICNKSKRVFMGADCNFDLQFGFPCSENEEKTRGNLKSNANKKK